MKGIENDEELTGGNNDEATKLIWRNMMPNSGISKIQAKNKKLKGGKMKFKGATAKTGKGPGKGETVSSQFSIMKYISSRGKENQ